MKWFIFKLWCVGMFFCFWGVKLANGEEVVRVNAKKEKQSVEYEHKIQRYKTGWANLIPQYRKFQYAGSMGLLSVGVGWDYGRREQWETDFFLGYLPRWDGDRGYLTMTLKENYVPWQVKIRSGRLKYEPLTISLYVNKIFGDKFWESEPDKYPNGYYGFMTSCRLNFSFGQRICFKTKPIGLSEQITLFYELGTSDLYLISYFTNKYLQLSDIFHLSLGIKLKFI